MKKHGWKVLAAMAVAAGAIALGLWWTDTTGAASLPDGIVAASGRIEARRVRVASAVGGRVLALHVTEGDQVEENDRVARLDTRSLESAVRRARAGVAAAEAAEEEAGRRIGAFEARLALARRGGGALPEALR